MLQKSQKLSEENIAELAKFFWLLYEFDCNDKKNNE